MIQIATPVISMSAISRLLGVLGWDVAPGKDGLWSERSAGRVSERSSSPRYQASRNEALLGWCIGEKFIKYPAQFRIVGLRGALIVTRQMPPTEHVWVALARPVKTRWYATQVYRVRKNSQGLVEVELAFRATSDANHFKALICKGEFNAKSFQRSPRLRSRY